MKILIMLIGVLLVLSLSTPAGAKVTWRSDLPSSKAASLTAGKPVFLFFCASWCGPCHMMEDETFQNPGVQAILSKMICVKLDVDQHQAEAMSYDVSGIPRIIILPPGGAGAPIFDTDGFMDAPTFLSALGDALHIKTGSAAAASLLQQDKDLTAVESALSGNRYAALKRSNPKSATKGMTLLVNQLGVFDETQMTPLVTLVAAAGDDAVPSLIGGMSSNILAVRAGSYRAVRAILKTRHVDEPIAFDPWQPASKRRQAVRQWMVWWSKHAHPTPERV